MIILFSRKSIFLREWGTEKKGEASKVVLTEYLWYNCVEVKDLKALILAAGYAMRLYPLTKDTPKALLPIGGRKMIDFLMDQICAVPEIDETVIVTNHRFASQFEAWAAEQTSNMRYTVLDDGTTCNDNRIGAIGDMQFAIEQAQLEDDLLVAASDNLFTFSLNGFVDFWRKNQCDCIAAKPEPDVETCKRFAIATLDEDGRVVGLVEKPQNPPGDLAVYALYLYRKDTLPLIATYLKEGNEPDSPGHFPEWLYRRKPVKAYIFDGECIDIGTHATYEQVCREWAKK